jgi:hypothetical protein
MRGAAILDLLTNFADEPADRFVEVFHERFEESPEDVAAPAEEDIPQSPFVRWEADAPAIDIDALVTAARHEERQAAEARTTERLSAERTKMRVSAARLMRWKRAQWAQQVAAPIADGIRTALRDIEQRLSDQLEVVLTPFIREGARAVCLQAFKDGLAAMIESCPEGTLRLRGDPDLIAEIAGQLADKGLSIATEPSDAIEVTALLGDTAIKTCLASFSHALGVALAPFNVPASQAETDIGAGHPRAK